MSTDIQQREAIKKVYGPTLRGKPVDKMTSGQVTAIYLQLKRANRI